jgi:hypothetical protein
MKSTLLGAAAAIAALAASSPAGAADTVPASLAVPAGQSLLAELQAKGVQVYRCQVSGAAPGQWTLAGPDAELFDAKGRKLGRHFAGPTWELDDGSKVVGEVVAKDPGPDASAVPWLLLRAKESSGKGLIGKAQSVQRIATVAGKAPSVPCDAAANGHESRSPYSATYRFFGAAK